MRVRTTVDGRIEREQEFSLARGANQVAWTFGVDNPPLWWPWSLGDQDLAAVTVAVHIDHEVSDARFVRTGFRQVSLRNWVLSVNGERLFLKGANLEPTRMALAAATGEELRARHRLARDAGLDLVRVHAHVAGASCTTPPTSSGCSSGRTCRCNAEYTRGVRRQAIRMGSEVVDLLGHHPVDRRLVRARRARRHDHDPGHAIDGG